MYNKVGNRLLNIVIVVKFITKNILSKYNMFKCNKFKFAPQSDAQQAG